MGVPLVQSFCALQIYHIVFEFVIQYLNFSHVDQLIDYLDVPFVLCKLKITALEGERILIYVCISLFQCLPTMVLHRWGYFPPVILEPHICFNAYCVGGGFICSMCRLFS